MNKDIVMEQTHSTKTIANENNKKLSSFNSKVDEIEKEVFDGDNNFGIYYLR